MGRHDVKHVGVLEKQNREVKITIAVPNPSHDPPVGLRSAGIYRVQTLRTIEPGCFHLDSAELPFKVQGQVVRKSVPYRPKHPKPPFEKLRHNG